MGLTRVMCAGVALILASLIGGEASSAAKEPVFPAVGTPYANARLSLLKQGLKVAPDRAYRPNPIFREADCRPDDRPAPSTSYACRALFTHKRPDGWRDYVVVWIDANNRIAHADFAVHMDGLMSIPPPEAADVPKVGPAYMLARRQLRDLGYHPARMKDELAGTTCANLKCKRVLHLPEAECAADVPICNAYWTSPTGRFLKIMTVGEIRGGRVNYEEWISGKEFRRSAR